MSEERAVYNVHPERPELYELAIEEFIDAQRTDLTIQIDRDLLRRFAWMTKEERASAVARIIGPS